MTKQADLIGYLFDGQPHVLAATLLQWMEASARFTAFVDTHRAKIRKKMRVTRESESVLDLRAELEVPYCLLNDHRLAVAYEPYTSAGGRGPDFAVTYRANLAFNIEVARMRRPARAAIPASGRTAARDAEQGANAIERARREERIVRILLDKLGQMQSGMANLLVIHTEEELARSIDLARLMQAVKTRAEGKDPWFYTASRYANPAAFYKDFLHLSGILLWAPGGQLWVNKQSRPGLEEKVLRLVGSLPCGTRADRG